ncbi:MAG TPA: response regulator [Polyangiaceae bacterium]|nr:response regulator [Polyangiaceae bacterium]
MGPVMVVEDDEDIRTGIAEVLRDEGYAVVEAKDGAEGLERVDAGDVPALILVDLTMPRVSGPEFVRAVRDRSRLAQVPIVLLTGALDSQRYVQELGVAGCLGKPFSLGALLDVVAKESRST